MAEKQVPQGGFSVDASLSARKKRAPTRRILWHVGGRERERPGTADRSGGWRRVLSMTIKRQSWVPGFAPVPWHAVMCALNIEDVPVSLPWMLLATRKQTKKQGHARCWYLARRQQATNSIALSFLAFLPGFHLMAAHWYSTNGQEHKRLSNHHTSLLDQAFDRRIRVQIFDIEAFGPTVVAIANPFAGTMTAGDIHYGLYRQPSLWQQVASDTASLDTLILLDFGSDIHTTSTATVTDSPETDTTQRTCHDDANHSHHTKDFCRSVNTHSNPSTPLPSESAFGSPTYRFSQRRRPSPSQGNQCICCTIS